MPSKGKIEPIKYHQFKDFCDNNGVELYYKESQIKKRLSYKFWKPIVQQYKHLTFTETRKMLGEIWNSMDNRSFYGSQTQSAFDAESLAFCIKELDE